MPAVGVPVTLRILSAPEPREHRPKILDRLDHVDRIVRFDFANLDVGARGDMRIAAAVALGEIGDARKLRGLQDAVRQPQPAHVGILVRRDVEQAEVAPAEIVGRLGILVFCGVRLEPLVGVERMFVALEFLRVGQLAACGEHAILRLARSGIRTDWLAWTSPLAPHAGAGQTLGGLGDLQRRRQTLPGIASVRDQSRQSLFRQPTSVVPASVVIRSAPA